MTGPDAIRILHDPRLDGPTNMARDEALMTRVGGGASPPTLRLYEWDPPTVSLGYFQHYADYETLEPPAGGLAVVRRLTGGGAILHDIELTYALTLPSGHGLLRPGATALYGLVHDAAIAALRGLGIAPTRCGRTDDSGAAKGPFFCFARRHAEDVLLGADKLAGSAQRRTRDAVLQHGSIVLGNRFTQHPTATIPVPFEQSMRVLRSQFPAHLSQSAGVSLAPGAWTPDELDAAAALCPKYAGAPWTRRR